jgi:cyclic-di-GMP phosphodiesterase TipF (flagellum assembly factor)
MRIGAVFIVVCMAIIAASAGAVAYLYLGVNSMQAAIVAVATFTALALYHAASTRVGLRSMVGRQLADLSRGGADVARQVAELGRRVAALEGKIETTADHARAVTDPLAGEVVELRTLIKRLVETLEGHQAMLDALAHGPSKPQGVSALPAPAEPAAGAPSEQPAGGTASDRGQEAATAATGLGVDLGAIRSAIYENPSIFTSSPSSPCRNARCAITRQRRGCAPRRARRCTHPPSSPGPRAAA